MSKILILNGPNLNLLGVRNPSQYGKASLQEIEARLQQIATSSLIFFQSNHEGQLIDRIHQALVEQVDFIIINPAAFTHTSIALRDALEAVSIPFIEVHLSNIYARERFRHDSYFSSLAQGSIVGLGSLGYELALQGAERYLSERRL